MGERSNRRWSRPGVPHAGWAWVDVTDLGEAEGGCQMCFNESVRYIHTVSHSEHPNLHVGCVCAAAMCGEGGKRKKETAAYQMERELRRENARAARAAEKARKEELERQQRIAEEAERRVRYREKWTTFWTQTVHGNMILRDTRYLLRVCPNRKGGWTCYFVPHKRQGETQVFYSKETCLETVLLQVHDTLYPSSGGCSKGASTYS